MFTTKKEETIDGHTPQYWVDLVTKKLNNVKNYRASYFDRNWFVNWSYYWGLTNLRWNPRTRELDWAPRDPLKFNVNEIYSIVRAIRNAVTRDTPRFDVDTKPYTSVDGIREARLGTYLYDLYDRLGMKKKVKEAVLNGLIASIGIWQYGWDEKDGLFVESLDPFDVYIDPNCAGDIRKAQYAIKVVRTDIEDVLHDKMYKNTEGLQADSRISESPYKTMLESKVHPEENGGNTIMLYEAWMWVYNGDKKELKVVTVAPATGRVLRVEDANYEELPFIIYQPDINPGRLYSEGWVKNLVPLQRALNINERNTLEFHTIFAKGKYVTTPNSNIKVITNENGQIIRKNRGEVFEQLDMKPMTSSVFNQNANLMRYMQDIGAANEAFMGRAPGSLQSGTALETLVSNNMVHLADLIDNLQDSLSQLGEALLRLSYKYLKTDTIKVKNGNGSAIIRVVGSLGQKAEIENDEESGILLLPERAKVRVVISAGMAFTKQGKQETLFRLRQGGDIDRRTLLEELGGLNEEQIEARLAQEREGKPISENGVLDEQGEEANGVNPEELADFLESQNLAIDERLQDNPELLNGVLNGQVEFDIRDGIIVPRQQAEETGAVV